MFQSALTRVLVKMFPSTRVLDTWRIVLLLLVGSSVAYGGAPCEPSSLRGFTHSSRAALGAQRLAPAAPTRTALTNFPLFPFLSPFPHPPSPLPPPSSSLVLHWARNASHLQLALEAKPASGAESGWFSVGWTANRGRMYPADCVIGNLPGSSVGAYRISGYSQSDVAPSDRFKIGRPVLSGGSNGGTIIRFSRFRGDGGTVPVSFTGSSNLIWAFSESGSTDLAFHGDNAFNLHWKTGADTIAMAADVATSGWVAVGWSSSGKMYPADAAIGNLPPGTLANGAAVGAYHLSGYGVSDVALTSSFELTNTTATTANGRTTITALFPSPSTHLYPFPPPLSLPPTSIPSPHLYPFPPPLSLPPTSIPSPHLYPFPPPLSLPPTSIPSPHLYPFPPPLSLPPTSIPSPHPYPFPPPLRGATSALWAFLGSKPEHPSPFPPLIHPLPPPCSFERPLSVGSVPISSSGATAVLWAFSRSDSQQLDDHGPNE
ncbi:unnamed protein product [Closterium sp. Naga37s-1]|nr:unnamed protein product [Closterium sp. Naga37s-1]